MNSKVEVQMYNKEKLYTLAYLTIIMEIALLYILYFGRVQAVVPLAFLKETISTCYIYFIAATMFAVYSIGNIIVYIVRVSKSKNNEKLDEVTETEKNTENVVE